MKTRQLHALRSRGKKRRQHHLKSSKLRSCVPVRSDHICVFTQGGTQNKSVLAPLAPLPLRSQPPPTIAARCRKELFSLMRVAPRPSQKTHGAARNVTHNHPPTHTGRRCPAVQHKLIKSATLLCVCGTECRSTLSVSSTPRRSVGGAFPSLPAPCRPHA